MSEVCEHPLCTRLISTKCVNHCQLDLCQEHVIEHKNLFLVQYEKSFNKLNKSINDVIYSIEDTEKDLNIEYEKELSLINQNHKNEINLMEQKSSFIISTQNLIKKKLQLLADVKNGQGLLYQYDIEQIKLYLTKIHQYADDETIKGTNNTNDIQSNSDNYLPKSIAKRHRDEVIHFRGYCPLTRLGIYGLNNKHDLRLCSAEKEKIDCYLLAHFHRYHHLTWSLSYQLTEAIINKSNPLTTCLFPPETDIIDKRFYMIRCPLRRVKLFKKRINCKNKFFKDSLKQHLLTVHHLTLNMSNKIIDTIKTSGDLHKLHFDENDYK